MTIRNKFQTAAINTFNRLSDLHRGALVYGMVCVAETAIVLGSSIAMMKFWDCHDLDCVGSAAIAGTAAAFVAQRPLLRMARNFLDACDDQPMP